MSKRPSQKIKFQPAWVIPGVFVLFAILGVPVYKASNFLVTLGFGLLASVITASFMRGKEKKAAEAAAQARAEREAEKAAKAAREKTEASPYSPEVTAIINDGRTAMKEMGRLYSSIPNPAIRSRINEIMAVSDKIVRDAIDDPSDVPQIRKFLDYYLPTTIKLLNSYDRMCAQEITGENISSSMERIENMLEDTVKAYNKQLDALFANQAQDIQMDIEVMNGMLAREGLGGKSGLDFNAFMKDFEKQQKINEQKPDETAESLQKGSTSNG